MVKWRKLSGAVFVAFVLALMLAGLSVAGVVNYPKIWSTGEVLTATDLNADFAALTGQINGNLEDTNLKASAAIKGTKLADAPNGIPTSKINDSAVTSAKVQDGSLVSADLSASAGITSAQIQNGTLVSADLNAAAGITGAQLSASAGITGSQLAAGANIAGTQLAAAAGITRGQLAVDATGQNVVAGSLSGPATIAERTGVGDSGESAAFVTAGPVTTRGGRVLLMGTFGARAQAAGNTVSCTVTLRLKRSGSTIRTWSVVLGANGASDLAITWLPSVSTIDVTLAGAGVAAGT